MMRTIGAIFCFLFIFSTARAEVADYRVTFMASITSGMPAPVKAGEFIITGPRLIDERTGRLSSESSYKVQIPFHGLEEIEFQNRKTYIDPYALAAMFEDGLNKKSITFKQVNDFLNNYDWIEGLNPRSALAKKLKAPTQFRVSFQAQITSGFNGLFKRANIVITGPNIMDSITKRASSMTSNSIEIPFHGFDEVTSKNNKTFIDPYALAAMFEEGLNKRSINIKEVDEFLSRYDWIDGLDRKNALAKKLKAPTRYKVSFEADVTSGVNSVESQAVIVMSGPGISDPRTKKPSSKSSHYVGVPFHGFDEMASKNPKEFVDPFAFARLIEVGLNARTVTVKEVTEFLSQYDWITKTARSPLYRKLTKTRFGGLCQSILQ